MSNLIETAGQEESLSTLASAVDVSGLSDELGQNGPYTVFAPTDDAFAKLPTAMVGELLSDTSKLREVIEHHVVLGSVTGSQAVGMGEAQTLEGDTIHIRVESDGLHVDDAKVIRVDVRADNGVIHIIDTVLIPDSL